MLLFDELFTEFNKLNEEELFYKEYHKAKGNPQSLREYLINLDRKIIDAHKWWIPELHYSSADYFPEHFIEDSRRHIKISRHNRYTPLFVHCHAFFEMIYVYKGTCENTVEGNTLKMNQGDICIIAPQVNHSMGVFDDDSIVINIIIRKSTFKITFMDLFIDDTILSLFFNRTLFSSNANSYITFSTQNNDYLQTLLKFLIVEGFKKEKYYQTSMENILRTVFCFMLRKSNEMILSNTLSVYTPEVLEILRYIQTNYKTVALNELATKFNYSSDYIGKLIKRHTGTSFINLLKDIKFKKACKLLTTTNLRVIDICYAIGYDSIEFFTRKFKQIYGVTPAEYRKKNTTTLL